MPVELSGRAPRPEILALPAYLRAKGYGRLRPCAVQGARVQDHSSAYAALEAEAARERGYQARSEGVEADDLDDPCCD